MSKQDEIPNEQISEEDESQTRYMGMITNILLAIMSIAIIIMYLHETPENIEITAYITLFIFVVFLIVLIVPKRKHLRNAIQFHRGPPKIEFYEMEGNVIAAKLIETRGILSVKITKPFVVNTANKIKMHVKNVSPYNGIRIRFHSVDHVSPTSIDLPLKPGEEKDIEVSIVPVASGEREISIEFATLFDKSGRLIPKFEAEKLIIQRFKFYAREPATGGITSSQINLLKTIVTIATGLVFLNGIMLTFFSDLIGSFANIFTTIIPLLIVLQVPVFYIYFALMNRLPQV